MRAALRAGHAFICVCMAGAQELSHVAHSAVLTLACHKQAGCMGKTPCCPACQSTHMPPRPLYLEARFDGPPCPIPAHALSNVTCRPSPCARFLMCSAGPIPVHFYIREQQTQSLCTLSYVFRGPNPCAFSLV